MAKQGEVLSTCGVRSSSQLLSTVERPESVQPHESATRTDADRLLPMAASPWLDGPRPTYMLMDELDQPGLKHSQAG